MPKVYDILCMLDHVNSNFDSEKGNVINFTHPQKSWQLFQTKVFCQYII